MLRLCMEYMSKEMGEYEWDSGLCMEYMSNEMSEYEWDSGLCMEYMSKEISEYEWGLLHPDNPVRPWAL